MKQGEVARRMRPPVYLEDRRKEPVYRKELKAQSDYGVPRPMNVGGKGNFSHVIYVVCLRAHPEVVKIGMSMKWSNRRRTYADWNLANGDGIEAERVFTINEEYVDLAAIERAILNKVRFPRRYKNEWFVADIDEAARFIDSFLMDVGLAFTISHGQ